MKNGRKRLILFWLSFCGLFGAWRISLFLSLFIVFIRVSVVEVSFCGFINGISLKMCILCVRVKINKRSFELFCVWVLF